MAEYGIRPAELADAAGLTELLRRVGWWPDIDSDKLESTLSGALADDGQMLLVAENDTGRVVGYASVHWNRYLFFGGPEGYLSELFIDEDCRGRGLGRHLLDRVKAEAESRGCTRLMLITGRNRESYERGFYIKNGWTERERMANFVLPLDKATN